jgi:hypothetical protein
MKWFLTLVLCIPLGVRAQQPLEVFDAPTQEVSSDIQRPVTKTGNKLERRSFRLLESLFVWSTLEDLRTTDDFLHHSQYVEYRGVCGGQPCGSMSYGHNPTWFTEVGRPARIFGCAPRSIGCSILANAVNDTSTLVSANLLHRRGKLGRIVAWGLLAAQFTSNLEAWLHNKSDVLDERRYVPSGATDITWYNP